MQKVLILGAGKSSGFLISYLHQWQGCKLVLADLSEAQLAPYEGLIETVLLKPDDLTGRFALIQDAYLVISMLPAFMHASVADDCLKAGVNMATASYISDELRTIAPEVHKSGLWFMNECGLDPGLDHMSAMKVFHDIKSAGGSITGFYSYCGGLVSPESMDNPWGYKFSWNPRNVILAGQGTARYMEHGELRFMPYSRLFERVREVEFEDGSRWDAYPNRDSLSYREVYALKDVKDMVRGTLRYQGYCDAWHIFVLMGITDDSYQFPLQKGHTYKDFASSYLPGSGDDFRKRIKLLRPGGFSDEAIEKVLWTGLFDAHPIGISEGSPAMILQHLLEARWKLQPADKDLVLMQHLIEYEHDGAKKQLICSLRVSGTDAKHTAMAKTVGLPLAITCRLFLENKLKQRGVLIPIDKEVYLPVLAELEANGISFSEVSRNL